MSFDNEEAVLRMVAEQRDMKVPAELIPRCPRCGRPLTMNLRCDDTFAQDEGWYRAAERYGDFYPFWKMTAQNPDAVYACLNLGETFAPREIAERSICIDSDIGEFLKNYF